jgi:hypothetical protein
MSIYQLTTMAINYQGNSLQQLTFNDANLILLDVKILIKIPNPYLNLRLAKDIQN